MRTIYKYPLFLGQLNALEMPVCAIARFVGLDPATGDPALWAEVETTAPKHVRYFTIYGTGHAIEAGKFFIGTVVQEPFVWHVYEESP